MHELLQIIDALQSHLVRIQTKDGLLLQLLLIQIDPLLRRQPLHVFENVLGSTLRRKLVMLPELERVAEEILGTRLRSFVCEASIMCPVLPLLSRPRQQARSKEIIIISSIIYGYGRGQSGKVLQQIC